MSARPSTLKEVAGSSASLREFGLNLRDWLHELRRPSSRNQASDTIEAKPPLLRDRFAEGAIADAWLGAYAEHLSQKLNRPAPAWAFASERVLADPAFDLGAESPVLRTLAVTHSPAAFKRRNIFTPSVDLPLRLRAGRPTKSPEEKRKKKAERQKCFRKARQELARLRAFVGGDPSHIRV